jgi:hypothetical protein
MTVRVIIIEDHSLSPAQFNFFIFWFEYNIFGFADVKRHLVSPEPGRYFV